MKKNSHLLPPFRILADENIPLVGEAFVDLGPVRLRPGHQITPAEVREAEVLLVRSVTQVDTALVEHSLLRFVGSATIGTDHIDMAALAAHGIAFAHAPGSNAASVVEYVLAALLRLAVQRGEALRAKTIGIVGCGNIGGRLAKQLPALGVRVLKHDPPLAARFPDGDFVPLGRLLDEADMITLHVPLTHEGPYATYHLFDETVLRQMKPGAWLLNTARGPAVSTEALTRVLADGHLGAVVLDVWENEPTPSLDLLRQVDIATPHIAGYSYDGKVQGTVMLYDALTAHLGLPRTWNAEAAFAPAPTDHLALTPPDPTLSETAYLDALVRQCYNLPADDARMRRLLRLSTGEQAAFFSHLRKHYPRRRAFARHTLAAATVPEAYRPAVADGLQIRLT